MSAVEILIVEDEIKIAESLQQGLQELGYAVTIAFDGKMGLSFFTEKHFDIAVLDINLPHINGLELCKRIREKNSIIPIIMLTTFGNIDNKTEGFNSGADDYMVKPFEFPELVLRINALLRRADTPAPKKELLQIADLELNPETKEVKRSGKLIQLTIKEFQLLEYFLKNTNKIIARADIAKNVWDIDFDTGTNIIDVYVNYLRKKIDKDFSKKLIHTQVGFGYVMKEPED